MKKEKQLGSIKDLEILNYRIIKQKTRGDGHSLCLCSMEQGCDSLLVAHLNSDGHIIDSQVFVWTTGTKTKVVKYAREYYKKLLQLLLEYKI